MKTLKLRKMGCDFMEEKDGRASDCGNYRLRAEFTDRDGKRITADFSGGWILNDLCIDAIYYDENGNLDGKQMSSYNYLSVQKKTYFSSQPLTDAFISEKKKELECFQEYIPFDIQKIKFKRAKSYGVCYIS